MSELVAVTAIGTDQPGIVAAVSGVLVEHGANIEDSSMTILRGHFAMMLVVAVPDGSDPAELEQSVLAATEAMALVVTVRPISEEHASLVDGTAWNLAVYGADRPGIVHEVTRLLAARSVNIVDLTTRVVGEADHPTYVMLLELTIAPDADVDELRAALTDAGRALGVECSIHESEADVF